MDSLHTNLSAQSCPYCGEPIDLVVETIEEVQSYIEDCQVCCRPMVVTVESDGHVWVRAEDEV